MIMEANSDHGGSSQEMMQERECTQPDETVRFPLALSHTGIATNLEYTSPASVPLCTPVPLPKVLRTPQYLRGRYGQLLGTPKVAHST